MRALQTRPAAARPARARAAMPAARGAGLRPAASRQAAARLVSFPHFRTGNARMVDTRIILSGLWVATMLTYLWGDVLRIMAGHITPGRLSDEIPGTPKIWMFVATIMLVPILMVVLSLILPYPAARWTNIIVAIVVLLFNIAGLPYKGAYDNFLIGVSFIFNVMVMWYAWHWVG